MFCTLQKSSARVVYPWVLIRLDLHNLDRDEPFSMQQEKLFEIERGFVWIVLRKQRCPIEILVKLTELFLFCFVCGVCLHILKSFWKSVTRGECVVSSACVVIIRVRVIHHHLESTLRCELGV